MKIVVFALAAILSLSVMMAHAFAAEDDNSGGTKVVQGHYVPTHVNCQCAQTVKIPDKSSDNGDSGDGGGGAHGGSTHHKVKQINRLFRSDNIETGSSALDNIPELQPSFNNNNNTNTTSGSTATTATVTKPVCGGVVPGPCLDKTTGQIVP